MTNPRKSQFIFVSLLTVCAVVLSPNKGRADETQILRNQVQMLQQRVVRLQNQLADQKGQLVIQPTGFNIYDQWDPFEQMDITERQMNQFMKRNMVDFNPREDIKQTPDAYIVSMYIPDIKKNKTNLEIKNGMLIVSGDRNSEIEENKPSQYYLKERSFGRFLRTVPLPKDARKDSVEANYKNGVLTVKILRNKANTSGVGGEKIKIM